MQQVGNDLSNFTTPRCNITIPQSQDANSFLKNALQVEQTVAGGLIGLAAYTQSPEVAFLLARLAAQHSAQAAYLGTETNSTFFPSNSTSLIPAYTPDQILKTGNQTGQLGTYFNKCVTAPSGPCGQKVNVGPLVATLNSTSTGGGTSSSASPSSTATETSSASSSTSTSTARNRKYF